MIKSKLNKNKGLQKEFDKEEVKESTTLVTSSGADGGRDWDNDMQDFDNLMEQSISEA
jgi:hypothetical protein